MSSTPIWPVSDLMLGPLILDGQALSNVHSATASPAWLYMVMVPSRRFSSILPDSTSLNQSQKSRLPVMPRLSVISPHFSRPGILRTASWPFSPTTLWSMTSVSEPTPLISIK